MSTYGRITAFSTLAYEFTRTQVNSSVRRKVAPEMMQPPETSDDSACPLRPT